MTGNKKKIFIVEDNDLNLKLFRDLLQANGFDVAYTQNGFEAFDAIGVYKPDLVLMDIQLHGISGLEIITQLKGSAELKTIPIIAVTAFAMKDDKEKILASGCEDYIAKPISIIPFIEKVKELIGR